MKYHCGHVIGKLRDDLFITKKKEKNKIKILAKVKEPQNQILKKAMFWAN